MRYLLSEKIYKTRDSSIVVVLLINTQSRKFNLTHLVLCLCVIFKCLAADHEVYKGWSAFINLMTWLHVRFKELELPQMGTIFCLCYASSETEPCVLNSLWLFADQHKHAVTPAADLRCVYIYIYIYVYTVWKNSKWIMRCKAVRVQNCVFRSSQDELSWAFYSSRECFCWAGVFFCVLVLFKLCSTSQAWLLHPIPTWEPPGAATALHCRLLSGLTWAIPCRICCSRAPQQQLAQWGRASFVRWQVFPSWSEAAKNGLSSLWGRTRQKVKPQPSSRLIMQWHYSESPRLIQAPESQQYVGTSM